MTQKPTFHPPPSLTTIEAILRLSDLTDEDITRLKPVLDEQRRADPLFDAKCRRIFLAMQRSTPTAPVQDDDAEWLLIFANGAPGPSKESRERLERIASRLSGDNNAALVEALKRLSFAAQTSGGTAGPDDALGAAIDEAHRALRTQAATQR